VVASAVAALVALWAMQGSLSGAGFPLGRAATIAVGMTLQAIPFLLLGVAVAELIEAYVSPSLIARVFPTNPLASVFAALVAAFLLPVCDCSAVPIFRSLLRKGVPLSAATTLMLASPAINPLVIASTYYAFGSWSLVGARVGPALLFRYVTPPAGVRHDLLREGLGGLQTGRVLRWAKNGDTVVQNRIRDARDKRGLGANNHEIDLLRCRATHDVLRVKRIHGQ